MQVDQELNEIERNLKIDQNDQNSWIKRAILRRRLRLDSKLRMPQAAWAVFDPKKTLLKPSKHVVNGLRLFEEFTPLFIICDEEITIYKNRIRDKHRMIYESLQERVGNHYKNK